MRLVDVGRLQATANSDPEFQMAARYWNTTLDLESPSRALRVEIVNGRIASCRDGDRGSSAKIPSATITVVGSDGGWAEFLAPVPRPFYQDLLGGCVQHHGFTIDGDVLSLSAYYHASQRLFAIMRGVRAQTGEGRHGAL